MRDFTLIPIPSGGDVVTSGAAVGLLRAKVFFADASLIDGLAF
ncbi:hypothetical protein [Desulfoluna sp.]|nr:hypothetical protein [Desulfoluna sp.]